MDGISFDSLAYLHQDDTFVIECNDDFGGICEDIARLAGASHLLVDPLDLVLDGRDVLAGSGSSNSAGSSCYDSPSGRCFDKEIPSLFSEMEYLTEVSPENGTVIVPGQNVPIVVNPAEFSWTRRKEKAPMESSETSSLPESVESVQAVRRKSGSSGNRNQYLNTSNYRKILQNYIQKGKRKLEESSYSKMKATVVSVKADQNSTSLIETITCASYLNGPQPAHPSPANTDRTSNGQTNRNQNGKSDHQLPPASYRCQDCNSCFLSVERLKKHSCIITEQYQCQLCRREFRKRKTLEQHLKSHDKVFSTDDDLRR
ncbi:uncharacterized protein LOC129747275 [Uranotaenia lowii]|uniref:uncharacterized protein LOC129747275 n=1 Tax=Uranotaenia lowii TaxID=190385 RepID=UPI00247B22B8|nr:uncharacterized protein LOC129747275 [Uranotaenia lowii]